MVYVEIQHGNLSLFNPMTVYWNGTATFTLSPALTVGSYHLRADVNDTAGNTGHSASRCNFTAFVSWGDHGRGRMSAANCSLAAQAWRKPARAVCCGAVSKQGSF
jgi:Bacterial Ig-like domain